MLYPHHYYRQSLDREQRLCYLELQEAPPEHLEVQQILTGTEVIDELRLNEIFSSLSEEDMRAINARLEQADKVGIARRAKDLEQRVTNEVARKNLIWLMEAIIGDGQTVENSQSPKPKPEPDWWKESNFNPNNWSPTTKSNAVAIGAGVAVTALVLGGVWLWRKLRRGAEVAQEKAKQGWSWFKKSLVAGVAFGLGFLGFHGLKKAMQWLSPVQKLEESLNELKKQKQELEQRIANATAEQVEALKEQQRKLNDLIDQYQTRLDSSKQPVDSEGPVEPTTEDEPNAPESDEILSQKEEENLKQDAWANLVGNLVDTTEWKNISRENKVTQIKDVLEHNADLQIREIVKYSEALALNESAQSPFKNLSNDALSRQFAEFAVIDFIEKYSDQVVWHLVEVEGLNERAAQNKLTDLRVSEFFEYVTASFSMAVPLLDQLRKSDKQLADAISEVDIGAMARGDTALALTLEKAARDLVASNDVELSEEELDQVSLRKLARLALTQGGGSAESKLASLASATVPEEVLLREVYREIIEGNTHLYLLPLFHGERPDVPAEKNETDADVLKRIICTRLPANQAIRIFLYRKMIDDGNPLGLVLMQIEAIKILDNNDLYLPEKKYQVTKKIGTKALTGSFDEVVKKWQEHGLKVDRNIVDKALPILEEMGSIGLDAAKKIGTEKLALLYTLTIGTPTVLVGGGVVMPAISRRVILHNTNLDNIELILKNWKGAFEGREGEIAHGVRKHLKWFRADDVEQAASAYLELRQKLGKVSISDPKLAESLRRQLRLCMRDPMNATKWKLFGDRLAKLHAAGKIEKEAVDSVLKFAAKENRRLRSLLNIAVYQGKTNPGWIRRAIGFSARQFDSAWRKVKSVAQLTPAGRLARVQGVPAGERAAMLLDDLDNMSPNTYAKYLTQTLDDSIHPDDMAKILHKAANKMPGTKQGLMEFRKISNLEAVQTAAKSSSQLRDVIKVANKMKIARNVAGGATLGGLIGGVLIYLNEKELAETKDEAKRQILLARRQSLIASTAGDVGLGGLLATGLVSGPVGWGGIIVLGAGSIVSEALYAQAEYLGQSDSDFAAMPDNKLLYELRHGSVRHQQRALIPYLQRHTGTFISPSQLEACATEGICERVREDTKAIQQKIADLKRVWTGPDPEQGWEELAIGLLVQEKMREELGRILQQQIANKIMLLAGQKRNLLEVIGARRGGMHKLEVEDFVAADALGYFSALQQKAAVEGNDYEGSEYLRGLRQKYEDLDLNLEIDETVGLPHDSNEFGSRQFKKAANEYYSKIDQEGVRLVTTPDIVYAYYLESLEQALTQYASATSIQYEGDADIGSEKIAYEHLVGVVTEVFVGHHLRLLEPKPGNRDNQPKYVYEAAQHYVSKRVPKNIRHYVDNYFMAKSDKERLQIMVQIISVMRPISDQLVHMLNNRNGYVKEINNGSSNDLYSPSKAKDTSDINRIKNSKNYKRNFNVRRPPY